MKTSPFKVMTTAALATAVALPAVATTVDAAEVELKQIAFELDGEVQVVDFNDYVDAIVSESGDLYDYVTEASPEAIGVGEGSFVSYEALVNAIIDDEEGKTGKEVLAEVSTNEEALVSEDTVAEYKQFGEDAVEELAVSSVTTDNLKQLVVTFNQELTDKETAEKIENYSLEDTDGNAIDLQDATLEGNTVTLSIKDSQEVANQAEATLTLETAVTGEEVTKDVQFFDTTIPEVAGAEVVGNDTIKVSFTEPVKSVSKADFSVNGGELFIEKVEMKNNNTEANVQLYSSLSEGNVDVTAKSSVEDFAGFNVVSESLSLDVEEDTEAPEIVDYKDATPNGVTLVFNEEIELSELAKGNFYHTNKNNPVDADLTSADVNGNELTLDFTKNNLPEGTAYVYVAGEAVNDLWDNKNTNQLMVPVEVTVDDTKPEVDEISVEAEDEVKVAFSEKVSVEEDDFSVVDADGEELDVVRSVSGDGTDEITVKFTEKLSGVHKLVVDGVEDLAGNANAKSTTEFDVADLTDPKFTDFNATIYNKSAEGQMIVVNFGEVMATEGKYSVLDKEKYVIGSHDLADITNASVSAINNGKSVKIVVPSTTEDAKNGVDLTETDDISLARVADSSVNYTSKLQGPIDVKDEGTVGISSVNATSKNTLDVTFDSELVNFDGEDLVVYHDDATANGTIDTGEEIAVSRVSVSTNDDGNTVASLTLDEDLNADSTYGTNSEVVKVQTVASGNIDSKNEFGEDLVPATNKSITDKITPSYDSKTTLNNDGDGVGADTDEKVDATYSVANNESTFDLKFTENVTGTDAAYGTFFSVADYEFAAGVSAGSLSKGQFTVSESADTVTVSVYGKVTEELDVDYTGNQYLKDTTEGNQVDDFSVTVDVYGN